jgi:peroxiredoxin Q/BCP
LLEPKQPMKPFHRLAQIVCGAVLVLTSLGLSTGETVPDVAALNQDGKSIRLQDFRGKPVLIFFYPKDDTPGCTKEACSLRDQYQSFQKIGAVILGISRQDSASHRSFKEKHRLPFDLLTDEDGSVAKKLGVSSIPVVGLHKRQSLLISASGKVIRFYENVDPSTHSQEVLKDLQDYAIRADKSG